MTPRGHAVATVAAVALLAVVLHLLGDGELAGPPLADPGTLDEWYDERSPAAAMIALVRFVAELSAWYVLGLAVLHGVARACGARGVGRVTEALALPGTRRIVRAGLGLGLLAATAASGADPERAPSGTAAMRPLTSQADAPSEAGVARMVPRIRAHRTPAVDAEGTTAPRQAAPRATAPDTWRVADGESFWSIAADVLADHLGRRPLDREVDPYWRELIDRNRDRMVDPTDPDLIHPGQVFDVPTPPASNPSP